MPFLHAMKTQQISIAVPMTLLVVMIRITMTPFGTKSYLDLQCGLAWSGGVMTRALQLSGSIQKHLLLLPGLQDKKEVLFQKSHQ